MKTIDNEVERFAIENGYDSAIGAWKWNNYLVYELVFWGVEHMYEDKPYYILFKKGNIRKTNSEEYCKISNEINEFSNIVENLPIEIEPNITIKSFKFVHGGFPNETEVYKYNSTKRYGNVLSYDTERREELKQIGIPVPDSKKIEDPKFNEYVLGMIKYFHGDLGENRCISDAEWFEFNAALSNGKKLKSKGCNYLPITYYKFIAYLIHLLD